MKKLPQYWVIRSGNDIHNPKFQKCLEYINKIRKQDGFVLFSGQDNSYYGVIETSYIKSIQCYSTKEHIGSAIQLSLDEFLEIINNKENMITRKQYKELYDICCGTWKVRIQNWSKDSQFETNISFTDEQINEMFAAADTKQKELLHDLFPNRTKSVSLRSIDYYKFQDICSVDGNNLIEIRECEEYAYESFYLNPEYNWELKTDSYDALVLIPTKKK